MSDRSTNHPQQRPIVLRSRQPVRVSSSHTAVTPFSDFVVAKPQVKAKILPTESLKRKSEPPRPVIDIVRPEPFAQPAAVRQQPSKVLKRQTLQRVPLLTPAQPFPVAPKRHSKLQLGLVGMALIVFAVGLFASAQTVLTNHTASAQVAALSKKVDKQAAKQSISTTQTSTVVPSVTKPSDEAVVDYTAAPDLARYLNIPKLGVHARVQQVSAQKNGALGVPWDIFDTGWYTGSAKPGQPGATLIDGHVAAWTTHGVFYDIHTLVAGDQLQIVRGDGVTISYQVVKVQSYPAKQVDMHAALEPITPGVSGLNLITCAGTAASGTNNYNQRVIVFAKEVSSS